jgi:hypothetical protein
VAMFRFSPRRTDKEMKNAVRKRAKMGPDVLVSRECHTSSVCYHLGSVEKTASWVRNSPLEWALLSTQAFTVGHKAKFLHAKKRGENQEFLERLMCLTISHV